MCSLFVVSAWITFPKHDNDRLIFFASSRISPIAPVLPTFSLPAKSTKFNFPFFSVSFENFYFISSINIVWDLLLY